MTIGGTATDSQVDSIRHIRELLGGPASTVALFAHDHTGYQSEVVEPSLADGALSAEERREFAAYERHVFTAAWWGLRPGNAPHFVPPQGGEGAGKVTLR